MPLPRTLRHAHPPRLRPLGVWLVLQLLALAAACGQVRWSEGFPRPAERVALDQLLIVQLAAITALFPWLLANRNTVLAVIASAWPMLQLAAILSAATAQRTALAGGYLAGWIVALAAWRSLLTSRRAMMLGCAVAVGAAWGGVVASYIGAEFSPSAGEIDWASAGWMGPIMGAMALLRGSAALRAPWIELGTALLSGAMLVGVRGLVRKYRESRRKSDSGSMMGESGGRPAGDTAGGTTSDTR